MRLIHDFIHNNMYLMYVYWTEFYVESTSIDIQIIFTLNLLGIVSSLSPVCIEIITKYLFT